MEKNKANLFLSFIPPVARKLDSEFEKQEKEEKSPAESKKGHKKQISTIEPQHRLTLKDYLRLTNINRKSHSGSGSKSRSKREIKTERGTNDKDKSLEQDNSISRDTIEENRKGQQTLRSIELVRQQIKQDLRICEERMKVFSQNLDKNNPKFQNSKQAYKQLVFLCELHREIKESVQGGIEKSNRMLAFHIHDQIYNFIGKTQSFIEEEGKRKRTPSPNKKRNLTGTQMIKDSGRRRKH